MLGQDTLAPTSGVDRSRFNSHIQPCHPGPTPAALLVATAGVRLVALEEDDVRPAQTHMSMYQRLACARTHMQRKPITLLCAAVRRQGVVKRMET